MSQRQHGEETTVDRTDLLEGDSTPRVADAALDLPPYPERNRIHWQATGDCPRQVTHFSDAAGTRLIEARTERTTLGLTLYRETQLTEPRSAAPPEVVPSPQVDPSEAMAGCDAACAALGRLLTLQGVQVDIGREAVIAYVQLSTDPSVVRRVWRALGRLRVLDPMCGGGDWLMGCLQLLGVVGIACLERMQGWVGDSADTPLSRRRYADFRGQLARWAEMAQEGCRDRLAFERVLSSCLHGIDPHPVMVARSRRRLAEVLGGAAPVDEEFIDVREGNFPLHPAALREIVAPAGVQVRGANPPPVAGLRAWEEALMLDRAAAQLRNLRLTLNASPSDAASGWQEIARRRCDLRRLNRLNGGVAADDDPLHPWLEFPEILIQGGFHLVRGAGGAAEGEADDASAH